MAKQATISQRLGASPGKLALIGVLAMVLVAVIYVQFRPSSGGQTAPPAGAAPRTRRPPLRPTTAAAAAANTPAGATSQWFIESVDRKEWTSPEVAQVIRYDPFALPASFPQPATQALLPDDAVDVADAGLEEERRSQAVQQIQQKLAELQRRGVRVIIDGRKETAAMIGDDTIRVGDIIDGFTVTAIDADGVYVERKLEQ